MNATATRKTRKSYENELDHVALPLEKFTWNKADGTLVAEASDFGPAFQFHKIYNDAADIGIAIRSHHTGKVTRFVVTKLDMSGDDLAGWNLTPVDKGTNVRRVLIIND